MQLIIYQCHQKKTPSLSKNLPKNLNRNLFPMKFQDFLGSNTSMEFSMKETGSFSKAKRWSMVTEKLPFPLLPTSHQKAMKVTGLKTKCRASELINTLTAPFIMESGSRINITEKAFLTSQTVQGTEVSGKIILCMDLESLQTDWEENGKVSTAREDSKVEVRVV